MTGFLFSPRVPAGQERANCVSVIDIGPAHLHLNCDSQEFERIAADPSLLLSSNRTWQTRPLYALLGWALAKPFRLVAGANHAGLLPEYAGFVTLNFLLLLVSVLVFTRIAGARRLLDPLTIFPISLIVVNQVTKAFFWTPHLQMFNVFVPIASLALFVVILNKNYSWSWWPAGLLGVALGVGSLAYGAFAMTAVGAAVCIMAVGADHAAKRELSGRAVRAGLLLLAFLAPTAAWITFVVFRTGSFYSHEIDHYRQFVWIADSLYAGGLSALLRDLATKSGGFADTLCVVMPFSLAAGALAGLLYVRGRLREIVRANETLLRSIAVYAIVDVLFFWLMGSYASRLTWTIVPAIALLLAVEIQALDQVASDSGRRLLRAASVAATVLYMAYWYLRPGPWS